MENPISKKARSVIYLVGLIVAALSGVISTALSLYGFEAYNPLATQITSAIAIIVSIIARANLDVTSESQGRHAKID